MKPFALLLLAIFTLLAIFETSAHPVIWLRVLLGVIGCWWLYISYCTLRLTIHAFREIFRG